MIGKHQNKKSINEFYTINTYILHSYKDLTHSPRYIQLDLLSEQLTLPQTQPSEVWQPFRPRSLVAYKLQFSIYEWFYCSTAQAELMFGCRTRYS
jgi:hypothetical protein